MTRNLFVAAALVALAACGSERSGTVTNEDSTMDYTVDGDGEFSADITTEDGSGTIRSGKKVAVDLPDGISVYPGANVISNTTFDSEAGQGGMVLMESGDSVDEVLSYYRKQAEAAGVEIKTTMETGDMAMFAGEKADGTSVSVNASKSDDGSSVSLIIGNGLGR